MHSITTKQTIAVCIALALVTIAVYWQVSGNQFVNYDDAKYLKENIHVRNGLTADGVIWAFTSTYMSNWHPLTWLSHMLDVELLGMNAGAHHLVNVFIHAANAVLLYLLLLRMTGAPWQSLFVSALFALHPLHVESVAWAAERKDVLSGFFWLLTLLFYHGYAKRGGSARYLLTLCSFALGLLSKPMLVTLPVVFLLMDYWPLGRMHINGLPAWAQDNLVTGGTGRRTPLARLLWEKAPFLALSALSSIVTMIAQHQGGAMASMKALPLGFRVVNALWASIAYIGKMIWPLHLAVIYPLPPMLTLSQGLLAGLFLAGMTLIALLSAKRRPYLVVGWFWYLITLLPVIGLVQVGRQAMADRYTYIPLIGLFIMIAWSAWAFAGTSRKRRVALSSVAGLILAALAVLTWLQTGYWKDSFTLFSHAVKAVENNYIAHEAVGRMLGEQGRLAEARRHYAEALRVSPDDERSLVGMGNILIKEGRIEEGISYTERALSMNPNSADGQFNMGYARLQQGREREALEHYFAGLRIDPDNAEIHHIVGVLLGAQGRLAESADHFREALRIQPDYVEGHYGLGIVLLKQGRIDESIGQFRRTLELKPDFPEARRSLDAAIELKKKNRKE